MLKHKSCSVILTCLFQDAGQMGEGLSVLSVVSVLALTVLFHYFPNQYTEQEAKKLGVVGWVKNTSQGTVTGQVQGPEEKVNE
ncbi:hypothetical protein DV515_00004263, partial [Chloebia gouldiae]